MSEWISVEERLPDVAAGDEVEVIVCVCRGHNGKPYSFSARYLNCYALYAEHDEDADEEGCIVSSGWYDVKQSDEYDNLFSPLIDSRSGDVVTHWMPMPAPPQ